MHGRPEPSSLGREGSSRERLALVLWLGLAALQITASFALGGTNGGTSGADEPIYDYSLGIGSLFLYAILASITLGIARLLPDPRRDVGLRPFQGRYVALAAGVVVVSLIVSAVLEPVLHAGEKQGLTPDQWRPDRLGAFLFNAAVIVLVVPVVEELFFRGLGVRLLSGFGAGVAVGGSALIFGLAHGIPAALPPLVVFGLGLAWIRLRSQSVWPGVIAHGAYNALGLLAAVLSATT